jgi:hypothetical protein
VLLALTSRPRGASIGIRIFVGTCNRDRKVLIRVRITGRRKEEGGRRRKEEEGGRKEEGRRLKEEGGRRKEEEGRRRGRRKYLAVQLPWA